MFGIGCRFFAKLIERLSRIPPMPKQHTRCGIGDFLGIETPRGRTFHQQKSSGNIAELHVREARMRAQNGHFQRFETPQIFHFAIAIRCDVGPKFGSSFDFVQKITRSLRDDRGDRIQQNMGKVTNNAGRDGIMQSEKQCRQEAHHEKQGQRNRDPQANAANRSG